MPARPADPSEFRRIKAQIERPAAVFAELAGGDAIAGDRAVAAAMRAQSEDPATNPHALAVRFWRSLLALMPATALNRTTIHGPLASLSRLRPGQRNLLLLKWLSGLGEIELAAILERRPEALRRALSRALARLGEEGQEAQAAVMRRVEAIAPSRLVNIATSRSAPKDLPQWDADAPDLAPSPWRRRLLVATSLIIAFALAATWWLPAGLWGEDGEPDVRTRDLAEARVLSRFNADVGIATHPDRVLLSMSDADAAIARETAFYSWYQAERLGRSNYEPPAPTNEAPEGGASSEELGSHGQ